MKEGKPIWGIAGLAIIILGVIATVIIAISHTRPSEIPQGEAEIVLDTNGGVPYEWVYKIEDESIVEHSGVESKSVGSKDVDGGPVEETHKFKALKKGETTIIFEYKNFVDKDEEQPTKTRIFRATVDHNLKLEIEEISEDSN